MKILFKFILILLVAFTLLAAAPTPPPLPSSFYGNVNAPVGSAVVAWMNGKPEASTKVISYKEQTVYALDIGGYHNEGDRIYFTVNGRFAGMAEWHTGTNVNLKLFVWWFYFRR